MITPADGPEGARERLDSTPAAAEMLNHFRADFTIVHVNEACARVVGLTPQEMVGKSWLAFVPEDQREGLRSLIQSATPDSPMVTTTERVVLSTGEVRWHEWANCALFDAQGCVVEYQSVGRDITERRRAEERLRMLSSVAEQSSEGMAVADLEGRLLFVNRAFAESHGYQPEELIGQHLSVFHTPEQMPAVEAANRQIREGDEFYGEIWHARRDGTVFPTAMHNTLLRDDAGQPIGILGTLRDITERKQAEEALRAGEERFRAIFEQAADSVLLFDATGVIVEFNDHAHENLGYTREEFATLSLADIAAAETPDEILRHCDKVVREGAEIFDTKHRTKSGEIRDVQVRARPFSDRGRDYILSVWRDVTDERRAAAALAESEERYRALFEQAADAVVLFDAQTGAMVEFNDQAHQHLGYTREEFVRLTVPDYEVLESPEMFAEHCARIVREGSHTFSTKQRTKGGEIRDIQVRTRHIALRGRDYILGIWHDVTEERRAQAALAESEERYRAVTESALDAIFCADAEGRYTFCNQAMQRLVSLPADRLLGKTPEELFDAEDAAVAREVHEAVLRGEPVNAIRTLIIHGQPMALHAVQVPLRDERGSIVGVAGIARDVTEQQRLADALRASEERYRAVTENAEDAIFCKDAERRYTFANAATLRFLGMSAEQFLGKTPEEIFDARNAAAIRESDQANLRGEVVSAVRTLRLGDRDAVLHTVQVPLRDEAGQVVGITGIVRDVTEQHRLEEALRASEATYRAIFNATTNAIYVHDCETGAIVEMNAAAREQWQWLGRPTDHTRIEAMASDEAPYTPEEALRRVRAAAQGQPQSFEWMARDPLGRPQWFLVDLSAAVIHGQPRVLAVSRDITELRRVQEERLRIQKLESLGLLAGGIAHDFNNVLMGVLASIALAKLDESISPDAVQLLSDAEKAVSRAKGLTHQLLTFSRGGAPVRRTASVGELLRETTEFALSGSNVRPHFTIPADLWAAEVDVAQISQVVQNLVINAREAMPGGGAIEVAGENAVVAAGAAIPLAPGRYVKLVVRDSGVGIAPEHVIHIFDPYFTTKGAGSGLGLAVAHSVVRKHGGHVLVQSRLGVGSTFEVYLPAAGAPAPHAERASDPLQRQGRVLVMDDDAIIRRVTGRLLEKLGFTVAGAADGAQAVGLYRQALEKGEPFDVVILDLTVVGGMGGEACLQELRALDPDVRAIVASGFHNDPVMAEFRQRGFRAVVAKPYTLEQLVRAIDGARA